MYVLQLKDSNTLYYGGLGQPFFVFQTKESAEGYILKHRLGITWNAVKASKDLMEKYFNTSF